MDDADQLVKDLQILEDPELNDEDRAIIERVETSSLYQDYAERKAEAFGYSPPRERG